MKDAMEKTIQTIRDEHRSISAVLSGLRELAKMAQDPQLRPRFNVLHSMIHYIDAFPERLHHPKEEEYLFKPLQSRGQQTAALVQELFHDHLTGARMVRALERTLLAFEIEWPKGAAEFSAEVKAYTDFHWDHMRKEERELLPLAQRCLTPEDWHAAAQAFAQNHDPLEVVPENDFDTLFTQIVNLAPAPIGLGEPWKKINGKR